MPPIPLIPQIPQPVATLVGALIGALIGSIGAAILSHWLTRRREEDRIRKELVQQHLFQLQDATESLWYRLHNLAFRGGEEAMRDEEYYKLTTLYSLGKLLAVERIFTLEGIYPQLDAAYGEARLKKFLRKILLRKNRIELGKFLRKERIDLKLRHIDNFQQYDRIFLAEAVIEGERERLRASTFVEFVKRYEATGSTEKAQLDPIWLAVKKDRDFWTKMVELLDHLHTFAQRIWQDTHLKSRFLDHYVNNDDDDIEAQQYYKNLQRLKSDTGQKTSIVNRICKIERP